MIDKRLLRVGPAVCLPAIARAFGKDPAAAFAAAGVDERLLADADNKIELRKLAKAAYEVSRLIGRPDLGLLIAKSYGPHSLGFVLKLAERCDNVREALLNITCHLQHHNQSAFLSLTEAGGDAIVRYELYESDFEGADIVLATAIGNALNVMRGFCGQTWCPAEVRLSMAKPERSVTYELHFGAPVRFESPMDALVFSGRWLDHPLHPPPDYRTVPNVPPDTWDLADHVRHQISMRIGFDDVTAPVIASALGLSRRGLDRQLAGRGVTFKQLLDDVRFARARRLLSSGEAPLAEISLALGYSEPSSFSRAFRMWTGMQPQAWREQFGSRSFPDKASSLNGQMR